MIFNPLDTGLPVCEIIPEIKNHLQNENTLIVNAAPGAGKSTLVPLCLLDENWLNGKKILMLEPVVWQQGLLPIECRNFGEKKLAKQLVTE